MGMGFVFNISRLLKGFFRGGEGVFPSAHEKSAGRSPKSVGQQKFVRRAAEVRLLGSKKCSAVHQIFFRCAADFREQGFSFFITHSLSCRAQSKHLSSFILSC